MPSSTLSIDKYFRIHINTLKIEAQFLTLHHLIYVELLSVPSNTRRQIATIVSGRNLRIKIGFNTPVMRQIQASPTDIVICK